MMSMKLVLCTGEKPECAGANCCTPLSSCIDVEADATVAVAADVAAVAAVYLERDAVDVSDVNSATEVGATSPGGRHT